MINISQRNPAWKEDVLGFGDKDITIGNYGCLLTCAAMVLSSQGFSFTPKTLNEKLKAVNGFTSGLMYTQKLAEVACVTVKMIPVGPDTPAPLATINQALDSGIPVIVEVDASVRPGFQNHWVVICKRDGTNYMIADPWPYPVDLAEVTLQKRYGFAGPPQNIIHNILILEPVKPVSKPVVQDQDDVRPEPGQKIVVVTDKLRLRNGPSTQATQVVELQNGIELVAAGEQVFNGGIEWQPVKLFVAAGFNGEKYIEVVK